VSRDSPHVLDIPDIPSADAFHDSHSLVCKVKPRVAPNRSDDCRVLRSRSDGSDPSFLLCAPLGAPWMRKPTVQILSADPMADVAPPELWRSFFLHLEEFQFSLRPQPLSTFFSVNSRTLIFAVHMKTMPLLSFYSRFFKGFSDSCTPCRVFSCRRWCYLF
jgi:hypothetical protein